MVLKPFPPKIIFSKKRKKGSIMNNEYYEYLDDLRESGVVNMFGAGAYLEHQFGLSRYEAKDILIAWMKQYSREDTEA